MEPEGLYPNTCKQGPKRHSLSIQTITGYKTGIFIGLCSAGHPSHHGARWTEYDYMRFTDEENASGYGYLLCSLIKNMKGYDLCVLTSGPSWKTLYSFTLPPNRNTIPNACQIHRMTELFAKWIVTVCLKVFREHHTPNQPFIRWLNVFLSPEAVSAVFGLETLN